MEKMEITVAGHRFNFSPFSLYDKGYYFLHTGALDFKMVLIDGELKLINPGELPVWLTELEERLSDAIFSKTELAS